MRCLERPVQPHPQRGRFGRAMAFVPAVLLAGTSIDFSCGAETLSAGLPSSQWRQLSPLPDRLGVAGAFAGVSGGAMVVAGGANFPEKMPWEGGQKVWHDAVYVLEKPAGQWRRAGQLPRPLAYGVSVSYQDQVICVGGNDSKRNYDSVFRLRWHGGKLLTESLASLPVSVAHSAGAIAGSCLYVACGVEGPGEQRPTNRAFAMNLSDPRPDWSELDPLPGVARFLAVSASRGGEFYVFGGVALESDSDGKARRRYLRDAFCYRPGSGWKRLAGLPKSTAAGPSPAPLTEGRFLLLPGDDGANVGFVPLAKHPGFSRAILAYDPAGDRWSEAGEAPASRATTPCIEWSGMFIIPSGEVRPGVRSPEVWALSSH